MAYRPRRRVARDDDAGYTVLGRTRELVTTDEGLARAVAAELDRVDPLECSPDCPVFSRDPDCCGWPPAAVVATVCPSPDGLDIASRVLST